MCINGTRKQNLRSCVGLIGLQKKKNRHFRIKRKNLSIVILNILSMVYIQNNNDPNDNNNYTHRQMGTLPVGSFELDKLICASHFKLNVVVSIKRPDSFNHC